VWSPGRCQLARQTPRGRPPCSRRPRARRRPRAPQLRARRARRLGRPHSQPRCAHAQSRMVEPFPRPEGAAVGAPNGAHLPLANPKLPPPVLVEFLALLGVGPAKTARHRVGTRVNLRAKMELRSGGARTPHNRPRPGALPCHPRPPRRDRGATHRRPQDRQTCLPRPARARAHRSLTTRSALTRSRFRLSPALHFGMSRHSLPRLDNLRRKPLAPR
jgi:hypothetical protein